MQIIRRFFPVCATIFLIAAAQPDSAVISGSTNGHDYKIVVRSDGSASISSATTGTKAFSLAEDVTGRFFADVEASHNDGWTSAPCAKRTPPYESTVYVTWHGWTSGDVTCGPGSVSYTVTRDAVRLNNIVLAIIVIAGPPAAVPCRELPPADQPPNCH